MESYPKKSLGIAIGTIAFITVFFVTVAGMRKSVPVPPPAAPDQTASANPPAQTQVAVTPAPAPARYSGEDSNEGGGDDEAPVRNPVPAPAPAPAPVVPPATVPKKTTPTASVYKNGTYSATGSYMSPGGYDQLGVSLTIQNDIVTAATVTNMAGDGRSSRYQNAFIGGYKPYVIGQNIASINLSYVSGASLTPAGFNDAVAQIKAQAKA